MAARRLAAIAAGAPAALQAMPRVGLALSGGGIRSATFCLGLVRGLAQNGLLHRFDYLSTVSGGGYIGAVLGRLIQRLGVQRAEATLAASGSQTLQWLRHHGRYLTPRGARDLGMAIATYLRSGIAVQLEFGLAAIVFGVLTIAPHLLQSDLAWLGAEEWSGWWTAWWPIAIATWLLFAPGTLAAYWPLRDRPPSRDADVAVTHAAFGARDLLIAAVVVVAAAIACWMTWRQILWPIGAPGFPMLCALVLTGAAARLLALIARLHLGRHEPANTQVAKQRNRLTRAFRRVNLATAVLLALGVADILSWQLKAAFEDESPWFAGGIGLGTIFVLALRALADPLQKLAASSDGPQARMIPMLLNLIGLLAAAIVVVLWVALVQWVVFSSNGVDAGSSAIPWLSALPHWVRALVLLLPALAWLVLTAVNRDTVNTSSLHNFYRARLTRAYLATGNPARFGDDLDGAPPSTTSPARDVTEVVDGDDLSMIHHQPESGGGPLHLVGVCLNQTREDVSGLYNADRKGLPLTVSARGVEVGRDAFHAAHTVKEFGTLGRWVAISGAAASPGAGAYTTPGWAALLFLLGARLGFWFEPFSQHAGKAASLGHSVRRWFAGTKFGLLAGEALASFHGPDRRSWYLSDGGHFDNTGVHALLKRELDFILLADCGADPQFDFGDIENLVRKARIDYDADIEFYTRADAQALLAEPDEQLAVISPEDISKSHEVRGVLMARICYRRSNLRCRKLGTLLIVKPSLHEALDTDLLAYARRNPSFPHQSTADQFFDEAQWESYHRLGEDMGRALSGQWLQHVPGWLAPVQVPSAFGPLRRPSFRSQAADAADGPFWRRNAKVAAIGATLGLGALGTLALPAWQVLEEFRSRRDAAAKAAADDLRAIDETVSGTLGDWLAGNASPPSFSPRDAAHLEALYFGTTSSRWRGDAATRAADMLAQVQGACGIAPTRSSEALCPAGATRLCRTVCDRSFPLDPYWQPPVSADWRTNPVVQQVIQWLWPPQTTVTRVVIDTPVTIATTTSEIELPVEVRADPPPTDASQPSDPDPSDPALPASDSTDAQVGGLDACVEIGVPIALYVHVYDTLTRQEANRIGELELFADRVSIAGIEDVVRTAQARGSKPPLRWAHPTLLVHRRDMPVDAACARAIGVVLSPHLDAWYGRREPAVDVLPLPASIRSDRHVLELWLPPASSRQPAEAFTSD